MPIAAFPGTYDPITRGHEDLIVRGLRFADRVIVAVAAQGGKAPVFSAEERVELARLALGSDPRIEVRAFDGLLVDFCHQVGATLLVRGLRYVSDFEYEYQMALMNRKLAPDIETVFLAPAFDHVYLSSSLVREVARFGGDVTALVHPKVAEALRARFPKR
jgi:pantetheine-phosphate adenylyltransferase